MLHQVTPNARCEVRPVDERTADCGLWKTERAANFADQPPRIFLVRGCKERPEWVNTVDCREDMASFCRQDGREVRGRQMAQQCLSRGDHVLTRRSLGGGHPT